MNDPGETDNLATELPEKTGEMKTELQQLKNMKK